MIFSTIYPDIGSIYLIV